jgi:GT2 family glycosyltransferase
MLYYSDYSDIDVSVVIVNYNTKQLTINCIESIYGKTMNIKFEIIVSDNGSVDGSVETINQIYPSVKVIENKRNIGFGSANNRALSIARGKYVFYLNSDTILLNNAIKIFFTYMELDSSVGAVGCNLTNIDNNYVHSFGTFPDNRSLLLRSLKDICIVNLLSIVSIFGISSNIFLPDVKYQYYSGNVDYITGADLFVRNNIFARFDERFFLYYEETDLQLRLKINGYTRKIIDGPEIIHLQGGSDMQRDSFLKSFGSFSMIETYISRVKYLKKNKNKIIATVVKYILLLLNPSLFKIVKHRIKDMIYA